MVLPGVAVKVPPVQLLEALVGLAIRVSSNVTSDGKDTDKAVASINEAELSIVTIIAFGVPCTTLLAPKARLTVGAGAAFTVNDAEAVPELPELDVRSLVA